MESIPLDAHSKPGPPSDFHTFLWYVFKAVLLPPIASPLLPTLLYPISCTDLVILSPKLCPEPKTTFHPGNYHSWAFPQRASHVVAALPALSPSSRKCGYFPPLNPPVLIHYLLSRAQTSWPNIKAVHTRPWPTSLVLLFLSLLYLHHHHYPLSCPHPIPMVFLHYVSSSIVSWSPALNFYLLFITKHKSNFKIPSI